MGESWVFIVCDLVLLLLRFLVVVYVEIVVGVYLNTEKNPANQGVEKSNHPSHSHNARNEPYTQAYVRV